MKQDKVAINCAMQHIKTFLNQARAGSPADFAQPCAECKMSSHCDYDWLHKMKPLLEVSDVYISMAFSAQPKTQGSDRTCPFQDKDIHRTDRRNTT